MPSTHLKIPAHLFYGYLRGELNKQQRGKMKALDAPGQVLYTAALVAEYKTKAKTQGYLRRTHCASYLSQNEEAYFLNSFKDIGARFNKPASDKHSGWYTDDSQNETLQGVVIMLGRHVREGKYGWDFSEGPFLAGTIHSDWDGVTLYKETFDNFADAARYADRRAEQEAERCREEDEKFQREQRVEELREDIKDCRKACLTLLREMRPIRKGTDQFPESVCSALRSQVQEYLKDIRGFRQQIGELA